MATPPDQDAQYRRAERIPFSESVQIRKPFSMQAQGVDLGKGGIGLAVAERIDIGTPVELDLFGGRVIFFGNVCWSTPSAGGYRIGIQFCEEDASLIARIQALLAVQRKSVES
jgi:hypothetical protein